MRAWKLAGGPTRCGNCPEIIAKGDPMLVISGGAEAGHPWSKTRCHRCAGEPINLPVVEAPSKWERQQDAIDDTMMRLTGAAQRDLFQEPR